MANTYAFEDYRKETMARVKGMSLPISFKQSIEICNFLRRKKLSDAKKILQRVLKEEQAIPMRRFNRDRGHKPGNIAAGRYPKSASKELLVLLNSVEANAQFKGLNTANLAISHMLANRGPTIRKMGRTRGNSKRCNIEIIVEEKIQPKKEQRQKPQAENKEHKQ